MRTRYVVCRAGYVVHHQALAGCTETTLEHAGKENFHLVPNISQLRNHFNCTSGGLEPLQGFSDAIRVWLDFANFTPGA